MYQQLRAATVGKNSNKKVKVFEDNDRVWKKGAVWKQVNNIDIIKMPPRSPDLNPLDFSLNTVMNKLLLQQDKKLKEKRVSNKAYVRRIEKTADSRKMLLATRAAIDSMKKRMKLVADSGGELLP